MLDEKARLGSGGRFAAMVRSGKSPALAAYIGRRAYGARKMAKWSARGRARHHESLNPANMILLEALGRAFIRQQIKNRLLKQHALSTATISRTRRMYGIGRPSLKFRDVPKTAHVRKG